MILYRERLWPAPWLFLATALVIPASLLVFLPINVTVGIVTAIVLYAGCVDRAAARLARHRGDGRASFAPAGRGFRSR